MGGSTRAASGVGRMLARMPCHGRNCIYHKVMARGAVTQAGGAGYIGHGHQRGPWRSHTCMWFCLQGVRGGGGGGAAQHSQRRQGPEWQGAWLHGSMARKLEPAFVLCFVTHVHI